MTKLKIFQHIYNKKKPPLDHADRRLILRVIPAIMKGNGPTDPTHCFDNGLATSVADKLN